MKRILSLTVCLCLVCVLCTGAQAAGTVTDTLTVKVGYFGMETDRYVELATYHWTELYEALPLYQNAYSFFRSMDDGTYNTVIDSAYGFYISDLLDYAGVYSGDVQTIAFYTQDQSIGFFTSFTYADLFYTQRYYFNDLSAHIQPVYDENGDLAEFNADTAWEDCWTVQPMLALEDSWASYEIGTEHTAPNYSSLGTGNRFRLLFGQSYPLERRANQTAKYTHTVYITLAGTPKIVDALPPLDGTIGSHTVTFQMSVGQQALRDALAEYLNIASSDSALLEITGLTVTPDAQYSDLATVTLHYTVHEEGSVSLSFGFGGTAVTEDQTIITHKPDTPATEEPSTTAPEGPAASEQPDGGTDPQPSEGGDPSAPAQPQTPAESLPATEAPAPTAPSQSETPEPVEGLEGVRMYALPDELAARLTGSADQPQQPEQADHEPVTVLPVTQQDDRHILLLTGAGAVILAALGALSALRYYSKGRKKQ